MNQEDNWFKFDGSGMIRIPPVAGQLKCFQKIRCGNGEKLIVHTDKKDYNLWWDGKKFRFQGLK